MEMDNIQKWIIGGCLALLVVSAITILSISLSSSSDSLSPGTWMYVMLEKVTEIREMKKESSRKL